MATNTIKDKLGASAAMTITLASLASSTSGVGRQSTIVANASPGNQRVIVYYKIKQGTSPTGSKSVQFYLIRDDADGTPHRDGGAGASDAGFTVPPNMVPIHVAANKASPSTGDVIQGSFVIETLGLGWGIVVVHDTGVNLDSTGGNHWLRYTTVNPDIQAAA